MDEKVVAIKNKIDAIFDDVVEIRRYLHTHPELSEYEENTAIKVQQELDKLGIPYEKDLAGHGIVATIYGKDRDHAVGIRADMDALPITEAVDVPWKSVNEGVMHACGHDVHTSILLGTGKILNEMRDELPGSVKLFFQPSEETIGGANQLIQAGALKNPDVSHVIGLHVDPTIKTGKVMFVPNTMNAATCDLKITVIGESCHGAHPDRGIDPLLPACAIVTGLQTIITRRLDPARTALITIGQFHVGTKDNVISREVKMSGTIRTLDLETRDFIKAELQKLVPSIAAGYGAEAIVETCDGYPSLENDDDLLDLMTDVASETIGKENIVFVKTPSLGADDFAYFCHAAKGFYYNIGVERENEENAPGIHNEKFNPDENCIKVGMLTEICGALKILEEESKKW